MKVASPSIERFLNSSYVYDYYIPVSTVSFNTLNMNMMSMNDGVRFTHLYIMITLKIMFRCLGMKKYQSLYVSPHSARWSCDTGHVDHNLLRVPRVFRSLDYVHII